MNIWIQARIDQEKRRRHKIDVFKAAFEAFLSELTPSLHAAMQPFRDEFPHDNVQLVAIEPGVAEFRHEFTAKTSATVKLSADAVRKLFLIDFPLSPQCSREIPTELMDGKLNLNLAGIRPGDLAEYILMPLLFPGLVSDPATQSHL